MPSSTDISRSVEENRDANERFCLEKGTSSSCDLETALLDTLQPLLFTVLTERIALPVTSPQPHVVASHSSPDRTAADEHSLRLMRSDLPDIVPSVVKTRSLNQSKCHCASISDGRPVCASIGSLPDQTDSVLRGGDRVPFDLHVQPQLMEQWAVTLVESMLFRGRVYSALAASCVPSEGDSLSSSVDELVRCLVTMPEAPLLSRLRKLSDPCAEGMGEEWWASLCTTSQFAIRAVALRASEYLAGVYAVGCPPPTILPKPTPSAAKGCSDPPPGLSFMDVSRALKAERTMELAEGDAVRGPSFREHAKCSPATDGLSGEDGGAPTRWQLILDRESLEVATATRQLRDVCQQVVELASRYQALTYESGMELTQLCRLAARTMTNPQNALVWPSGKIPAADAPLTPGGGAKPCRTKRARSDGSVPPTGGEVDAPLLGEREESPDDDRAGISPPAWSAPLSSARRLRTRQRDTGQCVPEGSTSASDTGEDGHQGNALLDVSWLRVPSLLAPPTSCTNDFLNVIDASTVAGHGSACDTSSGPEHASSLSALREVGHILACVDKVFTGRTIRDETAWRHGGNRVAVAGVSIVCLSSLPPTAEDVADASVVPLMTKATPTDAASDERVGVTTPVAEDQPQTERAVDPLRPIGYLLHETGMFVNTMGEQYAMEVNGDVRW